MQNMCSFGCLHSWSATFSYYCQKGNLPGHASQVSEHQGVSIGYDALKKVKSLLNNVHGLLLTGLSFKTGKWWTWVPCKCVRRELLHFGQGFVGEPKVNFAGHVPALKSTADSWRSHSILSSIELVKWIDPVHDISFSKFPRNLVSSGYDFPLSAIFLWQKDFCNSSQYIQKFDFSFSNFTVIPCGMICTS